MDLGASLNELVRWKGQFPEESFYPIDRLAAALFVNSASPEARLMAAFSAYFDASGNAVDQPHVVVSGYIASYLQWKLIESTWRNIHKTYGVELPFHAADMMSATSNPNYKNQRNARQDYVVLAQDLIRAKEFVTNLSALELTMVNCAVTAIIPMDVYNGVSSLLELREVVPPYALGARLCIDLVLKWENTFDIHEHVECVFEEGDFEQGKFTDLMASEGMPTPIYRKKVDYAGLQGADHYAWERAVFMKNSAITGAPPRLLFTALVGGIPKLHIQATTQMLINVCEMKGIDPRTGVKHG
jgi:hypothetical protein